MRLCVMKRLMYPRRNSPSPRCNREDGSAYYPPVAKKAQILQKMRCIPVEVIVCQVDWRINVGWCGGEYTPLNYIIGKSYLTGQSRQIIASLTGQSRQIIASLTGQSRQIICYLTGPYNHGSRQIIALLTGLSDR